MIEIFNNQVSEPLRASIICAPLEDACHLARSCDRLRQEVETQAVEVLRCQTKFRDPTPESALKLRNMETKLSDLSCAQEARDAMLKIRFHMRQMSYAAGIPIESESHMQLELLIHLVFAWWI